MMNPIGRRVRSVWGECGEVVGWEPLSAGMCDTKVRHDDGREVWHAMHTLRPTDNLGPLPDRQEARRRASAQALTSLHAIRDQHVKDFNQPWPGCEFGKALIGQAIDGAISDLEKDLGIRRQP